MAIKKSIEGAVEPKNLWEQRLVEPRTMTEFVKETADTEKMILFGESSSGKTRFYLGILPYLKKLGVPKENILMCIVYPDRSTGLTKIHSLIPKEFMDNVLVFPINNYEEMVSSTAVADEYLKAHFKKTGVHGWLVSELLEESWRMSQDYYSRMAFGETLADLMAAKRQEVQELMASKDKEGKDTAYQALSGFQDWVTIKFFHNFNWIDKLKRMPYNIIFTAEIKEEGNKDSIFYSLKWRPSGEKDNCHRCDSIMYLSHKENNFFVKPFKLTGYNRLYGELNIADKNGYEVHKNALKRLEELGYKTSKIEELEKEAGIIPPKPKPKVEKPETIIEQPKEEKTVTVINKEGETKISKEEVLKTVDNDKLLDKVIKEEKVKKEKPKEVKKAEEDEWNI